MAFSLIDLTEKMEECTKLDPQKLIDNAEKIEDLVKLICYIGPEHDLVPILAESLYEAFYSDPNQAPA